MAERALITIRVHPGASRVKVVWVATPGQDQVLGVWVHERATEGKATEAALSAVAAALGVRSSAIRLVTGTRSRVKVVEVTDPPADLSRRLAGLAK
jgi:uncharacterized protein YggU (UPF0235/DUF167 family)